MLGREVGSSRIEGKISEKQINRSWGTTFVSATNREVCEIEGSRNREITFWKHGCPFALPISLCDSNFCFYIREGYKRD